MADYVEIHPQNPQARLVEQVVQRIREGAVLAYPTDSSYALGCHIGDKQAMERIRRIRDFGRHHQFTLLCRSLSEISTYAKVDNPTFRMLKLLTPGPYTFVLQATHEVPRRLQHERRRTIGVRIPDHRVARALLNALGEPLNSCTLIVPGETLPLNDPEAIRDRLDAQLDVIVDSGPCRLIPTTVLDLSGAEPRVLRRGRGDVSRLGL